MKVANHTSGDNSTKPGAKKLIAGNIMSAVQKAQRLTPSHRRKKKSKIIEELKIYDAELEAQPEFNGFTDLFHSFELYRGKVSGLNKQVCFLCLLFLQNNYLKF